MEDRLNLDDSVLDALREVGNIGAAHASTALSQMIGKTVSITVPHALYPIKIEEIGKIFGKDDDSTIMLLFKILGGVEGQMIIAFPEEQCNSITNLLMGTENKKLEMTEGNESAMKETGNILSSSYLTALSTLVGFHLQPSIPYIAHDMLGSILDSLIIELNQSTDYALITDTEFLFDGKIAVGKIVTFFGRDAFIKILGGLGIDSNINMTYESKTCEV